MTNAVTSRSPGWSRRASLLLTGGALLAGGAAFVTRSNAADSQAIPAPELDPAATQASETAVLAGGCFWGVQGVFQHVDGVRNAVSGYAGGDKSKADYETVSTGTTGHAEAVRVTYDPRKISYGRILQIYFSVAHDPTQLNRQGPDVGTQYRSTIFPANDEQARIAKAYIDQLNATRIFRSAIATTIEAGRPFYPAEDYHQDFMTKNPDYPYIVYHDLPKISHLKRLFPERYRNEPVLVAAVGLAD